VPVLQFHPVESIREGFDDPSDQRLPTPCHRAHRTGLEFSHKRRVYIFGGNPGNLAERSPEAARQAGTGDGLGNRSTAHAAALASSDGRRVSTRGPSSVTATVCSK